MREAASMIAQQSDTYAPSLATRVGRALARIWSAVTRHHRARRDLARLRGLDLHGLADLGLTPADLAGLHEGLDARAATRRLKLAAEQRTSAWARVDIEEEAPSSRTDRPRIDARVAPRPVPAT